MDANFVLFIGRHALQTALLVSAPMLITCLLVGVVITIIQAVTAIRDMTLSVVPKLIAMAIVGLIFGHWTLQVMIRFCLEVFGYMQAIGH
ncbi:MAG: flagellar biosynthetic protein FliQ [Sedimentisphaerales bacterium]|nr:flagellar biosynthetic protein FliQ [Sedimentisphaerales bacterium]